MRIHDLPSDQAKYLHPSFRFLVGRKKWKPFPVKRTIAQQIKRKLLWRINMPRMAPFYCEVCTLSSRHLPVLKSHECSLVNESRHIVSYENEVRIAQVGFKSKAKDSWAVMERLPNPQHVNLSWKINENSREKHQRVKDQPDSLRDLCLKSIGLPEESEFIPWEEDYDRMSQEEIEEEQKKLKMLEKNRRTGMTAWQCNICEKIFKSFADHDDHLAEGDCMRKGLCDPIEINPMDPTLSYPCYWKPKASKLLNI